MDKNNVETLMNDAESKFYAGRYSDAINLYSKVLEIEPTWQRAIEHSNQAKEYLQTGYIPQTILPSEVAIKFGKAQSMARVGRYDEAISLTNEAYRLLQKDGIQKWAEGDSLLQTLDSFIIADSTYNEGIALLNSGKFDEALTKINLAHSLTGHPKFSEKAKEIEKIINIIQRAQSVLSISAYVPDSALSDDGKKALQDMLSVNNESPFVQKLKLQIQLQKAAEAYETKGYDGYEKILERMLLRDPLNKDVFFRLEWVKFKKRVLDKQSLRQQHYQTRTIDLYKLANIWAWLSIIAAVVLFSTTIYIIILTVNKDNPLTAIVSFLSFVPIFASKLIYEHAKSISDEANSIREKMQMGDIDDSRMEFDEISELRKRVFDS